MSKSKSIAEKFESAYEDNKIVERAKFDAVMKDDSSAPNITLADVLFELLELGREVKELKDRIDEIEDNY